jgi:predicted small integral membrane protein
MGKWIMVIATVGGMGLAMLFAGRIGYWIERKVQARQLRRKKESKDNL